MRCVHRTSIVGDRSAVGSRACQGLIGLKQTYFLIGAIPYARAGAGRHRQALSEGSDFRALHDELKMALQNRIQENRAG